MDVVVRDIDPQAMTTLAAIVLGIVTVVRLTGRVPGAYLPGVAVVTGLIVAAMKALLPPPVWGIVESGVIIGLAASGLWSGVGAAQTATAKKGRAR